jgi:hypothetical protein
VTVGESNTSMVHLVSGLAEGDEIALDARRRMNLIHKTDEMIKSYEKSESAEKKTESSVKAVEPTPNPINEPSAKDN